MIIALASPSVADSIPNGLRKVEQCIHQAALQQAVIVCFPEAYLPGLRGLDFVVPKYDRETQLLVMHEVSRYARESSIAVILGMEFIVDDGRQIGAAVFDRHGKLLGCQSKNQLDPTEEPCYVPGKSRQVFEVDQLKFGISICHEGFRYPETVRWAAVRGAKVVFHPHCTGSDQKGTLLAQWGAASNPYYEQAMMMRSRENTIYFASVNYAFRYQESATSLIVPSGDCHAFLPYGQEGVLVQEIDLNQATGLLASRLAPERYKEATALSSTISFIG